MTYRKELKKEFKSASDAGFPRADRLSIEKVDKAVVKEAIEYLSTIKEFYTKLYKHLYNKKSENKMKEDQAVMSELKRKYSNESLEEFVTNKNEYERIVEYKGKLIQKTDPIYLDPMHPMVKAHFYAPRKKLFGEYYNTFLVNVMVIWISIIMLYVALYYRLLKRFLDFFENLEFGKKSK